MSDVQRELALLVTGKDVSASRTLKNTSRQITSLEKHASKAGRNIGRNLERGFVIAGAAAVGAVGYAVSAAGDFEAQLNTINTIARATPEALSGIGDTIRAESRESGTAVEDLTAAYYDLLSAGVKTADAQGVLHTANTLAIGGLSSTAEAVDLLTTAINTYGGDATQGARIADEFAVAIERGKVTAAELAASYASVGPLAASMNVENAELAAGYARLTAGGTQAGEATTQMAAALTALLKKTGPMKALEKVTGRNYAAIAGKKGLAVAYEQLRKDADKAGVSLGDLLGRKEALLYLLQVTGPNFDAYNADLAAVGAGAGTAAEQMGERQQGLAYQMKRLKANVHDAAITIGTELLPEFADLAAEGTAWLQAHQPQIKAFAKDLAGGIREAVKWARSLDWDAITGTLKAGAAFGKAIVEAFVGAPPWVQQFLAAGFVANKFTGGVIGDVMGELGKGLIRGVLGMNAGVVNINAGVVNGAGGLPGVGGKGGGLGRLGGVVAGGIIIGGVALSLESIQQMAAENAAAAEKGLNSAEIAAMRYYNASTADQATIAKRLGYMPTKADFDSAMAKLNGTPGTPAGTTHTPTSSEARSGMPELRQWRYDHDNRVVTAVEGLKAGIGPSLSQTIPGKLDQVATASRSAGIEAGVAAKNAGAETKGEIGSLRASMEITTGAVDTMRSQAAIDAAAQQQAVTDAAVRDVAATQAAAQAQAVAAAGVAAATAAAGMAAAAATSRAQAGIVAAIWAARPIVNVSPTTIQRTTVVQQRSGSSGGSRHKPAE